MNFLSIATSTIPIQLCNLLNGLSYSLAEREQKKKKERENGEESEAKSVL
jgi:hypothetical protein